MALDGAKNLVHWPSQRGPEWKSIQHRVTPGHVSGYLLPRAWLDFTETLARARTNSFVQQRIGHCCYRCPVAMTHLEARGRAVESCESLDERITSGLSDIPQPFEYRSKLSDRRGLERSYHTVVISEHVTVCTKSKHSSCLTLPISKFLHIKLLHTQEIVRSSWGVTTD